MAEPIGNGVPMQAVSGQQVVEGEGVYKCGAVGNYCCVLESCLFPLSLHYITLLTNSTKLIVD